MNLKKFISGVSAFAIATSAFAGMTINASAATTTTKEIDFIGSSDAAETFENGYDASGWSAGYRIKDTTSDLPLSYNGTAAALSGTNFKNGFFGLASVTEIEKPASYDTDTDVTNSFPTYVSGNSLTLGLSYGTDSTHYDWTGDGKTDDYSGKTGHRFFATYTFPQTVDSGKLYFSSDIYGEFGDAVADALQISFYNSNGEELVKTGTDNDYIQLYTNNYRNVRSNSIALRSGVKKAAFNLNLVIDVDAVNAKLSSVDYMTKPSSATVDDTTTYTAQRSTKIGAGSTSKTYGYQYGTGGNSEESSSITNNNYAIAYMTISSTTHTKRTKYTWSFDNTKLYKEVGAYNVIASNSVGATVKVDMNKAVEGETVTVTATPAANYADPVISVTGVTSGDTIPVDANGEFTMPDEDVNVTATATLNVTSPAYSLPANALFTTTGSAVLTDSQVKTEISNRTLGKGYDFYSRADIFLSESGSKVNFVPNNSRDFGATSINFVAGANPNYDDDGSSDNFGESELEAGKWYTVEFYTDMADPFETTTGSNRIVITVKDCETGNTVAQQTGVKYRNAGSNYSGYTTQYIQYTPENAYIANVYAYYVQDPYTVTASDSTNITSVSQAYAKSGDAISFAATPGYYPAVTGGTISGYSNGTYTATVTGNATIGATGYQLSGTELLAQDSNVDSLTLSDPVECDKYIITFVGANGANGFADYHVKDTNGNLKFGFCYAAYNDGVFCGDGERDAIANVQTTYENGDGANNNKRGAQYSLGDVFTFVLTKDSDTQYTANAYKNGVLYCARVYQGSLGTLATITKNNGAGDNQNLYGLAVYGSKTATVSAPEAVSFTPADDGVTAKAYKFTVTPGTNAVTSVTVTIDADHTETKSNLNLSGPVIFGIIVATQDDSVALPTIESSMITVQ